MDPNDPSVQELQALVNKLAAEIPARVDRLRAASLASVDEAERLARAARDSRPNMRAVRPGQAALTDEEPAAASLTQRFRAYR